jgi:hypothetical protein
LQSEESKKRKSLSLIRTKEGFRRAVERGDVSDERHIQEVSKFVIALELFVFTQTRVMVNSCGTEKGKRRKSQFLGNRNTSNKVLSVATPIFQVEVAAAQLAAVQPDLSHLHNAHSKKAS